MITIQDGTELKLSYADAKFTGYGHYQVSVELMYKGKEKTFKATTTDLEAIDASREAGIESWEDSKTILHESIKYKIEDQVQDWMSEVDYDLDNDN